MSAWILAINERSKRPECELGDIIGVYGFKPTATEREIFDCVEVTNVPVEEIREHLEEGFDPEGEYPKYKTSVGQLTTGERKDLAGREIKKSGTMKIIEKIQKKQKLSKSKNRK